MAQESPRSSSTKHADKSTFTKTLKLTRQDSLQVFDQFTIILRVAINGGQRVLSIHPEVGDVLVEGREIDVIDQSVHQHIAGDDGSIQVVGTFDGVVGVEIDRFRGQFDDVHFVYETWNNENV